METCASNKYSRKNLLDSIMPTSAAPSSPSTSLNDPLQDLRNSLRRKLERALALKEYALSKNLDVPDEVLTDLNTAIIADDATILNQATPIDKSIKALTAVTYPATIETVSNPAAERAADRFKKFLFFSSLCGIAVAVGSTAGMAYFGHFQKTNSTPENPVSPEMMDMYATGCSQFLVMALGFLGSMTYIYFNFIGVLSEKAFNIEDTEVNKVRLLLGITCGWLFYFFFSRNAYADLLTELGGSKPTSEPNQLLLLLPYLVGFSTKLVVGVLSQAVRAVELTLGLDSKAAQLAQRKTKSTKSS